MFHRVHRISARYRARYKAQSRCDSLILDFHPTCQSDALDRCSRTAGEPIITYIHRPQTQFHGRNTTMLKRSASSVCQCKYIHTVTIVARNHRDHCIPELAGTWAMPTDSEKVRRVG